MLNNDIKDEFHYGLNDISQYREALDDESEYKFDCFSLLLVGIESFLGVIGFLFSLFKK